LSKIAQFEIVVKTLTSKIVVVVVGLEDMVADMKFKLVHKAGIPYDQQQFIFSGKQLVEDCARQAAL